jgi:hypothetical protein
MNSNMSDNAGVKVTLSTSRKVELSAVTQALDRLLLTDRQSPTFWTRETHSRT